MVLLLRICKERRRVRFYHCIIYFKFCKFRKLDFKIKTISKDEAMLIHMHEKVGLSYAYSLSCKSRSELCLFTFLQK